MLRRTPLQRLAACVAATLLVCTAAASLATEPRPSAPPASKSIGGPGSGSLVDGVQLAGTDLVRVRDGRNWGTRETVDALARAAAAVEAAFPGSPPLLVGDISRREGGRLRGHRSHQSGRDADLGYYHRDGAHRWFKRATRRTLDVPRTWTLLASMLEGDGLEYAFVDWYLQKPLYEYARDVAGLSPAELDRVFQYPRKRGVRAGIIRHFRGHRDHIHVRFRSPRAVAAGLAYLRAHPELVEPVAVHHRVRRGDTLGRIARRHNTTVKRLRRWNRLRRGTPIHPGDRLVVGYRRPSPPATTSPAAARGDRGAAARQE